MAITYRNGVSIAEIIVYLPALAIAIFLSFRHGFGRSSGWLYIIIFCLARLIGPIMQLMTITRPADISLFTGSVILQTIGLSPLLLASLGLLSRVLESINKSHHTVINIQILKVIQSIPTIGLVLGIIGGVDASNHIATGGGYHPGPLNKAGTALFIVAYVVIVLATIMISFHASHAEPGEKRLVLAVAISLPFILVRLIYAIMATFTKINSFNQITGSVTILLCMSLIMEFIVVLAYEVTGLGLPTIPKPQQPQVARPARSTRRNNHRTRGRAGAGNVARVIAQKSRIGGLVAAALSKNYDTDVEMH